MNVKPGGLQKKMRDTVWAGKVQTMNSSLGIPKGMKQVLEERGINTGTLNGKQILKNHDEFRNEKPRVISYLQSKGHTALFLPKFHPGLNPIERVWGQAKHYSKAHCNYLLLSLRKVIQPAVDFVTLDNIKNFNRKARDYMFAYFEGYIAGPKIGEHLKKYKSHRRVGLNA